MFCLLQNKCDKCDLVFCESCLILVEPTGTPLTASSLRCLSCFVFSGPVLLRSRQFSHLKILGSLFADNLALVSRSQLLRLRVRDLVRQLRLLGVSDTKRCLTKAELVSTLADKPNITLLMDDIMATETTTSTANRVSEEMIIIYVSTATCDKVFFALFYCTWY